MSSLLDWESIMVMTDYKPDKVLIVHGDDDSLTIEITKDSKGNFTIRRDLFGVKNLLPIDVFERELEQVLTSEQIAILFNSWGMALSIMISRTANVLGIDKQVAKVLITQGERHGILYQGNNNTWKIKDAKIVKERWLDKAMKMTKGPAKPAETHEERAKRLRDSGQIGEGSGHDSEGPTHSKEFVQSQKEMIELRKKGKGQAIEIIPELSEAPFEDQTEEELRVTLIYLQKRLTSENDWAELENNFTINDKIRLVKAQLRGYDNQRSAETYKNEANALNLPRSVTEVPDDEIAKVDKSSSSKLSGTKRTVKPTKGKPSK